MRLRILATVAATELKLAVRSRLVVLFAATFALLALALSYFGLTTAGYAGFDSFSRTAASLLNLGLYLVPLLALVLGSLSLTPPRGEAEILLSQPIARAEVLVGKVAGLAAAVFVSTLGGFAAAGVVVALKVGNEGFARYAAVAAGSSLLGVLFVGLGALLAVSTGRRDRALGASLLAWFALVFLYDLLVLGGSNLYAGGAAMRHVLAASVLLNPIELARGAGLVVLSGVHSLGPAWGTLIRTLGGPSLAAAWASAAVLFWLVLPTALAARVYARRDL